MEEWKPIKGYEGLYEISNMGRVKSLKCGREKILKPDKTKRGYLQVTLCKDGKCKKYSIHRLVALHFVDGYFEGAEVDHLDTNPLNNVWTNLKFVTRKENCNNSISKENYSKAKQGENNPNYGKRGELSPNYGKHRTEEAIEKTSAKLRKKIYCIELDREFNSLSEASELLNINIGNLSSCLKGRAKHSYCGRHPVTGEKLHWVYVVE